MDAWNAIRHFFHLSIVIYCRSFHGLEMNMSSKYYPWRDCTIDTLLEELVKNGTTASPFVGACSSQQRDFKFVYHMCAGENEGIADVGIITMLNNNSHSVQGCGVPETLGMMRALRWLKQITEARVKVLSENDIKTLHRILMDKNDKPAGRFAYIEVGDEHFGKPDDEEFTKWHQQYHDGINYLLTNRTHFNRKKYLALVVKLAAFATQTFLALRPFCGGNGRVARLIAANILSIVVPFPVPIYSSARKHDDYIDYKLGLTRQGTVNDCYDFVSSVSKGRELFTTKGDPSDLAALIVISLHDMVLNIIE